MIHRILVIAALFAATLPAHAAIPLIINHQGFVRVSGVPFNGTGQFKFGLADGGTSNWLWTNDGSNLGTATEPNNGVLATVVDGLYAVPLGKVGVNMVTLPSIVFDGDDVRLKIYFNDGANGWEFLGEERITATAYSYHAAHADTAEVATTALGIEGYVHGGVTANAGIDSLHDLTFTSGTFRSSDNDYNIICASMTKQIDAAWAAGTNAGGWDGAGSVPAVRATIFLWAITDSTGTNAGDFLFSLSNLTPTMPSGYDEKRLIGGRAWEGSRWEKFRTIGNGSQRWIRTLEDPPTILDLGFTENTSAGNVDLSNLVPQGISRIADVWIAQTRNTTACDGTNFTTRPTSISSDYVAHSYNVDTDDVSHEFGVRSLIDLNDVAQFDYTYVCGTVTVLLVGFWEEI